MSEEVDVVEETTDYSYSDLIENQLSVIGTMMEMDTEAYDTLAEDRIKAISNAMKIIHRSQKAILQVL